MGKLWGVAESHYLDWRHPAGVCHRRGNPMARFLQQFMEYLQSTAKGRQNWRGADGDNQTSAVNRRTERTGQTVSLFDRKADAIAQSISALTCAISDATSQRKTEFDWFKSHANFATKTDLKEMENRIMATQAEAAQQVRDLTVKINKIAVETATTLTTVKKLQEIIDAGNGGEVSEELQTALNEAIAAAQATDDLTPDSPEPIPE